MICVKPCGLVIYNIMLCCVQACVLTYPQVKRTRSQLAILCPVAPVALCSLLRLSSRLCCHRRYLNLACLHASPRPQHLSHCLLALPA
jgi:hypothetical protein